MECCLQYWIFDFHKMWGIYSLAEWRFDSEEGLCCIELQGGSNMTGTAVARLHANSPGHI